MTGRRTPLLAAALLSATLVVTGCGADGPVAMPTVDGVPSASTSTGSSPTLELGAPPAAAAAARCAPLEPAFLTGMDVAVDATVTDVGDGTVTLDPARWWSGGPADSLVLRDSSELARLLGGVPEFEVGQRYLVAASRGRVAVCGFTAPWSAELEAVYAEAFS